MRTPSSIRCAQIPDFSLCEGEWVCRYRLWSFSEFARRVVRISMVRWPLDPWFTLAQLWELWWLCKSPPIHFVSSPRSGSENSLGREVAMSGRLHRCPRPFAIPPSRRSPLDGCVRNFRPPPLSVVRLPKLEEGDQPLLVVDLHPKSPYHQTTLTPTPS